MSAPRYIEVETENLGGMVTIDKPTGDIASAFHTTRRISGLTHGFYRYPGTTSPHIVRSIIQEFTAVDDVVFDLSWVEGLSR